VRARDSVDAEVGDGVLVPGQPRFELAEDSPARTNDGRPKRWVVVRPPGGQTGTLLARADGEHQVAAIGNQHACRVGFFLHVDDFDVSYHWDLLGASP
jgi:hypothetical protein